MLVSQGVQAEVANDALVLVLKDPEGRSPAWRSIWLEDHSS